MKRGTPEHPKMKELAFLLGIDLTYAVGIMERLWHFTAKYAPCGDIGRFTDKAIAEAVGWKRPTGTSGVTPECRLRDALVNARWLDSDPIHRLIVHDWKDHCDQAVTRLVERRGWSFCLVRNSLPLPESCILNPLPVPLPLPESRHLESIDTVRARASESKRPSSKEKKSKQSIGHQVHEDFKAGLISEQEAMRRLAEHDARNTTNVVE